MLGLGPSQTFRQYPLFLLATIFGCHMFFFQEIFRKELYLSTVLRL